MDEQDEEKEDDEDKDRGQRQTSIREGKVAEEGDEGGVVM